MTTKTLELELTDAMVQEALARVLKLFHKESIEVADNYENLRDAIFDIVVNEGILLLLDDLMKVDKAKTRNL